MRCINCGWDNHSNTTVCLKCGQPLRISDNYADSQNSFAPRVGREEAIPKPTVLNANPNDEKCRKTVVFSGINENDSHSTIIQPLIECPNCSYPVVGEFTSCPNCGTPLKEDNTIAEKDCKNEMKDRITDLQEEKMICQQCESEIAVTYSFCPHCGTRIHRPTIRRQIKNIADTDHDTPPHCYLTIIPEENENISTDKLEYEGNSVILNRENTEISNRTITSKEQAAITFEDGHWYIVDRSELNTTYIQANRKIEIMPDDIIVLGDRRFKFECDSL